REGRADGARHGPRAGDGGRSAPAAFASRLILTQRGAEPTSRSGALKEDLREEDPSAHPRSDARPRAALAADGAADDPPPLSRVRADLLARPRRPFLAVPNETGRGAVRRQRHRRHG